MSKTPNSQDQIATNSKSLDEKNPKRGRGRPRVVLTDDEKKSKLLQRNRQAAIEYRERNLQKAEELKQELLKQEIRNAGLKRIKAGLETRVNWYRARLNLKPRPKTPPNV